MDALTSAKVDKPEPYFSLVNDKTHFRLICTSQDGQGNNLRDDMLVIEKKGCLIYT